MKICACSTCPFKGKRQSLRDFHKDGTKSDGLDPQCKTCKKLRMGSWYKKNKKKVCKRQKSYVKKNIKRIEEQVMKYRRQHPEKALLFSAKSRAKKKGIPFSITEDDIPIPTYCPLLGIKLKIKSQKGNGPGPASPTVDQKIPGLGYTPGNVWVVSWRANKLKSNAPLEELELLVRNLRRELKKR